MTNGPASSEQCGAAEALAAAFAASWNRRDGSAYGEAYWPDAELVDPTGQVWDGRDAIVQMHVDLWDGPASGTQVATAVRRVRTLGAAVMVVDIDVSVTGFSPPPPGAAVDSDGAVATHLRHVVEKRGSDWKIVASQNTFIAVRPG